MSVTNIKKPFSLLHNPVQPTQLETEAAMTIQRCFRRHMEPLTALIHPTTSAMPHRSWQQLLLHSSRTVAHKANTAYTHRFGVFFNSACFKRYTQKPIMQLPLFTSVGAQKPFIRLPSFEQIPLNPDQIHQYPCPALTPQTYAQLQQIKPFVLQTKEELDLIVQQLYKTDFISWEISTSDCYARTDVAILFLRIMGIDLTTIQKQFVLTHLIPQQPNNPTFWGYYHVAPLVKLADGSQWIIDPAINRSSALNFDEWIGQQADEIIVYPQKISSPQPYLYYFAHSPTGAISFQMSYDYHLIFSDDRAYFQMAFLTPPYVLSNFQALTYSRKNVEIDWAIDALRRANSYRSNP